MRTAYVNIAAAAPPGFESRSPTKLDLLGSRTALYADSLEQALAVIGEHVERMRGLVLTPADAFGHERLGEHLWHVRVPAPLREHVRKSADFVLAVIDVGQQASDAGAHVALALDTTRGALRRTRRSYDETTGMLRRKVEELRQEVAERARVEEALRASEAKYRVLVESTSDWIWEMDADGVYTYASPQVTKLLGYEPEEVVGRRPSDLMPSDEAVRVAAIFGDMLQTGAPIFTLENVAQRKDGGLVVMETSGVPVYDEQGRLLGCRGVDRDITERRQAEIEREQTEARTERQREATVAIATDPATSSGDLARAFRRLTEQAARALDVARVGVWLLSHDGSQMACIDEYNRNEDTHTRGSLLHADEYPRYFAAVRSNSQVAAADARNDPRTNEFADSYLIPQGITSMLDVGIFEEGEIIGVLCFEHVGPLRVWQPDESAFAGTVGSIAAQAVINAERRQAELDLRQLRNYLTSIIDSLPSVLIGVDVEGRVSQWNRRAEERTGVSGEEAKGRALEQVFPDLAADMPRVREAMRRRQTLSDAKRPRIDDGQTRYEDVAVYPLATDGVEGAVIRVDDITERVRIEEMMVQSEKMLSVGGLAAGMAHEINNPLAGMMQTANVMTSRLTEDLPANLRAAEESGASMAAIRAYMEARGIPRMLARITDSGRRAADIVTNMLSFARKGDSSHSSRNLAELLDQTLVLAGSDYDLKKKYDFREIEIVRDYAEGVPPVPCEAAQIQQVLLNIMRNGAEAMQSDERPGRTPRLTLRLRHEAAEDRVRVEIEDNGPGMDEKTCKRAFEPFFTTKPPDEGTGLGLSVSYFIVKERHGGEMTVTCRQGEGCRFCILLPVSRPSLPGRTSND